MASEPLEPCVCCERGVDSFDERWIDADVCRECSDALAGAGDRQLQEPGRGRVAASARSWSRFVDEMWDLAADFQREKNGQNTQS